jgi:predicted nucleic acid-binding protein
MTVQPITMAIHESGLALAECSALSVHYAMIIASALDAGCETLGSEEVQHGMVLDDRLRVIKPFQCG